MTMNIRHAITAAALTAGLSLGAVALTAPSTAGATVAPQTTTAQVQAFWSFLNALQHHAGSCDDIRESASGQAHQVVYGGSCLQAFLYALDTPGIAWEYVGPGDTPAPVLYGYYVDEGTPDAPQFVLIYTGTQAQTDASAAANPETGCSAPVSEGC